MQLVLKKNMGGGGALEHYKAMIAPSKKQNAKLYSLINATRQHE